MKSGIAALSGRDLFAAFLEDDAFFPDVCFSRPASGRLAAVSDRAVRASAARPLLEFQTAAADAVRLLIMNGFGARPLPAAISLSVRPEATERSSLSTPSLSPCFEYSSRCLINSQLVRLPPKRSPFIRTS